LRSANRSEGCCLAQALVKASVLQGCLWRVGERPRGCGDVIRDVRLIGCDCLISAGPGHVQRAIVCALNEAVREGAFCGVLFAELRARLPASQNERSLWRATARSLALCAGCAQRSEQVFCRALVRQFVSARWRGGWPGQSSGHHFLDTTFQGPTWTQLPLWLSYSC
jgi:hypothetical protein